MLFKADQKPLKSPTKAKPISQTYSPHHRLSSEAIRTTNGPPERKIQACQLGFVTRAPFLELMSEHGFQYVTNGLRDIFGITPPRQTNLGATPSQGTRRESSNYTKTWIICFIIICEFKTLKHKSLVN